MNTGFDCGEQAGTEGQARVHRSTGEAQVGIEGFAGKVESHDFGGAFEDTVDPGVAHHPLDRLGEIAPGGQRTCSFIAPASANLHEVIDYPPRSLGAPELAEGGLHPEVDLGIDQGGGHPDHGVGGVGIGSHVGDLRSDGFVTANFRSPLASFHTPAPGNF